VLIVLLRPASVTCWIDRGKGSGPGSTIETPIELPPPPPLDLDFGPRRP